MLLHKNTQRVVFFYLLIFIYISPVKLPPPLRDDERFLQQRTGGLRRLRTFRDPLLDRRGVQGRLLFDRIVPA